MVFPFPSRETDEHEACHTVHRMNVDSPRLIASAADAD